MTINFVFRTISVNSFAGATLVGQRTEGEKKLRRTRAVYSAAKAEAQEARKKRQKWLEQFN